MLTCLAMIGNAVLPVAAAVNPTTTIPLGFTPNQVVTADMNGDGKLDLLVSGAAQAVLLGNGDGTFKPPIITFAAGTVSAIGDFNGDGKLDLAVGSYYGGVTILLGNGDGTFGQYIPFSSDSVQGLAAADLNGDGRSDLVVTSFQETTVYISNGNGTFQAGARYPAASGVRALLADFNGDGKTDMVRLNYSSLAQFFAGVGDGTFLAPVQLSFQSSFAAVADLNGDGKPDLAVVSTSFPACIGVALGNGDGSFGFGGSACNGIEGGNPVVADFNGDGMPDVAVAQVGAVMTALGNGLGGLANPSVSPISNHDYHWTATGDFNGDGKADLAVTNNQSGSLTIYLNDGGTSYPLGDALVSPSSLAFGSVPAWSTSQPQSVTISNPGPGYLYFSGRTGLGNFTESNDCLPGTVVAPGASCTFQVTFNPPTSGPQTGSTTIYDSAPSGSQSVTFSGTGTINPSTTTVAPVSGPQGGTVNLTGTLTSNGAPVAAGGWVTLSLPNGWTGSTFVDKTGSFGWFGASLAGLVPGVYPNGIKAVYAGDGAYTGSSATADLTVTGLAPSIAVAPASGTYGGSANLAATITEQGSPLSGVTVGFALNGVSVGTATTDAQGTATLTAQLGGLAAGKHPSAVTVSFAGNSVYPSSSGSADLVVNPAPLTITASSATMTYGGAPPAITASYTGFVNGDTAASLTAAPTCTTTASTQSNVGAYPTSCSGALDANYSIGYVAGSVTVGPAPLTITASSATMTYGGAPPAITASYTGFVNGDTAASLTAAPTCTTTASTQSNVGAYPTSCSGALDANYSIGYVAGSVTVGPAPLTITASSATMTYGGAPPAITASYTGFVNGDTAASLTAAPTCTTTASTQSNVGAYPTSCSGAVDANYTIGYVAGSVTVGPVPLTITASSATMTYGGAPPAITASYAGFVNGDTAASLTAAPTCTTTASTQSNVGAYPTSCSGALDANYTIGYVAGSVTVGPAPLTVAADNQGRLFGFPNPGLTATITGFVNGDSAAVVHGAPSCTTAATQYSPGAGYPVVCTMGTLSAANYTFGPFVPGSLKVGYTTTITGTVPSVTVSAGQSVLIAPGAVVTGPMNVLAGGALDVEGATTTAIASSGAVAIRVCGTTAAKLTVGGTSSLVVVGDDEARPGLPACTGNKIGGPASVSGNSGGVEFDANTVSGYLTITGNTGTTPDGGTIDVAGNTVGGKTTIQP